MAPKFPAPSVPHASAGSPVFLSGLLLGDMHDNVGWAGGVYTCMRKKQQKIK